MRAAARGVSLHGAELRLDFLQSAEQRGQSCLGQLEVERFERSDEATVSRSGLELTKQRHSKRANHERARSDEHLRRSSLASSTAL